MQGPEPLPPSERSAARGARQSSPPAPVAGAGRESESESGSRSGPGPAGNDPPTVRTGSSVRRAWPGVVTGGTAYPEPGRQIDSFALKESIGVGGMGAVFLALDTRLDRQVALKILPPEQAEDVEVVQRFYQEGRAAARLDHENIARVFTIGHDAHFHFIAFEYIEGTTIRQRVERNGPLPVGEAINYTLQIAGALVHATERGVVHRDIKPSNIIVTPHGRAKLVDMGLARRFERGNDDGLTQSGMTLGTFDYISPEQARDPRNVDVRSDLYSLGCTLFHMLTGRPPFPDGTVLQKLLQHQEEPPPDVCTLNPLVPPGLASVLVKLMAKDRDRRYQSPEQLVRDLLTVAATLGLRSISPEGLVWTAATAPAAWERHLVWSLPAIAFAIVMATLAWWGQDPRPPAARVNPEAEVLPGLTVQAPGPGAGEDRDPRPGPNLSGRSQTGGGRSDATEEGVASPREIEVESSEDLLAVLASAPSRSIVVLADDGPYVLGGESSGRPVTPQLIDRDLTLKADAGVLPTLLLAGDAVVVAKSAGAILDLAGGRVTLEGLEFVLDADDHDGAGTLAAVRTEDTELVVRRCRFRTRDDRAPARRVAALDVRVTVPAGPDGDRPPAMVADACHFDGGQVAVLAHGPVDLLLRDCTLGGADPAIWLENGDGKTAPAFPPELRLRHDSLIAREGTVFRFEGAAPRVWIEDTVIAPARDAEATLVAADDPDGLDWRGRGNLYGRIATYLQPTGMSSGRDAVREFAGWAETAALIRETGSTSTRERPWYEADPEQAPLNPARAFRLAANQPGGIDVGVRPRQVPFGAPGPGAKVAINQADGRRDREARTPPVVGRETTPPKTADESAPAPMPMAEPDDFPPAPMPMAEPGPEGSGAGAQAASVRRAEIPVMPPDGREATPTRTVGPTAEPVAVAIPDEAPDPAVLRTAEQLIAALSQPDTGGGTLRVAADADWLLSGAQVRTNGRWTLKAEPGPTRPRFRFRPTAPDPRTPTAWPLGIDVRRGALICDGIDIILAPDPPPPRGRSGAFGVAAGTELGLTNCSLTIEGDESPSAAIVAQDNEAEGGKQAVAGGDGAGPTPTPARVRLTDSLLRTGGDLVEIGAGGRLTLEMDNVVVATGGCLVHAHGLPRGQAVAPVKLGLQRVTARMVGGLIQLESAPGEPELPLAEIDARDSILATTAQGAPLLQVDGQDDLDALQNRIRWDGLRVAYHQINAYRRDQTAQVGTVPKIYNRPDWMVAVGPQEEDPIHGDLKFLQKWGPDRSPWTFRRDDFRLAPDSPAAAAGADLSRIPPAPPLSP